MNRITYSYNLIACVTFLLCLSFTARGEEKPFRFATHRMENRQDSLTIRMELIIPAGSVGKNHEWRIDPLLKSTDGSKPLPYIIIQGQKRERLKKRARLTNSLPSLYREKTVSGKEENRLFYEVAVPAESWMEKPELSVGGTLVSCANRKSEVHLAQVTLPVREVPTSIPPSIHVNYIEPVYTPKYRSMSGEAYLAFETGGNRLIRSFGNNASELDKIDHLLAGIRRGADQEIKEMVIEGYASPEGSFSLNLQLSEKRAAALREYLMLTHSIPSAAIRSRGAGEDWEELRRLVEEGTMIRRENVLTVIDSNLSPDRKEAELKKDREVWNRLSADYFPRLRRAKYEVEYAVRDFEKGELTDHFRSDSSLLSVAELFMMAENYPPDSEEWHALLLATVALYPDDPVALINAGASALVRGETGEAGRYLEQVKNDPRAYNNLGAYHLLCGDLPLAGWYLQRATGVAGVENNLKELGRLMMKE